jgi:hypothetical protein
MTQGVRLVDLERVKFLLSVIHAHDDTKLELLILAASQAVLDYLGTTLEDLTGSDSSEPDQVPEVEQIATAMLVGKLYDGWDPREAQAGRLPSDVEALLYIRKRELGIA